DALEEALPGSVQVAVKDSDDDKESRLIGFTEGEFTKLVTKAKIAGHGMNWQHCADMVVVGITHSYEAFYQLLRLAWRYGQKRKVTAHVVTSDREYGVLANVKRKQAEHDEMFA